MSNKLNWKRNGVWMTSGNGNWSTELSDLENVQTVEEAFLPGLDTFWTEVPWQEFRETTLDQIDGWEWVNPVSGTKYVVYND